MYLLYTSLYTYIECFIYINKSAVIVSIFVFVINYQCSETSTCFHVFTRKLLNEITEDFVVIVAYLQCAYSKRIIETLKKDRLFVNWLTSAMLWRIFLIRHSHASRELNK